MQTRPTGIRQSLLQIMAARQPLPKVEFAPDEIVSVEFEKRVGAVGTVLRVPPQTCAVLQDNEGQLIVYPAGDHLLTNLPPGRYPLRYVDLRFQRLELPVVKAQTKDAWDVSILVVIVWNVNHPTQVLSLAQPREVLIETCVAALMDLIQGHNHDELVASPEGKTREGKLIAAELQQKLVENPLLIGLKVLNAIVMEKHGDRRRIESVQKAIVEKTAIEQELDVETQKQVLRQQQIDNELELAKKEEGLRVQQARVNRSRAEEEDRVRIQKARTSIEENNQLIIIQQRELALKQAERQLQYQHEEAMKAWEMGSQAFGQLAAAILQNQAAPGMMRPIDDAGRDALIEAMKNITQSMPVINSSAPLLGAPVDLYERVMQEIKGLFALENVAAELPEETDNGGLKIAIHYQKKLHILVEVGPDYPTAAPRRIQVQNGKTELEEFKLKWSPDRNLREIVLEVASRLASQAPFRQFPLAK